MLGKFTQKLIHQLWVIDMPLTDTECRKAQPKDKQYRLSDSHGLFLIITTKGQKYWNVRVTVHGERKSESLGPYPDLSLKRQWNLHTSLSIDTHVQYCMKT